MDGDLVSRKLKLIPNRYVRARFGGKKFKGIDGELISGPMGRNVFQTTTSAVMSHGGEPTVTWYVFDNYLWAGSFSSRIEMLQGFCDAEKEWGKGLLTFVPHVWIHSEEELLEYEVKCLAKLHEGIMIRDPRGPYKFGRSTLREGWLIKLKRFEDDEATIVGFEEKMHNSNEAERDEIGRLKRSSAKSGMIPMGTLGAFIVENNRFGQFNVGTGFSHDQGRMYWKARKSLIGKEIKFKYQKVGTKDKPRIPVFLGFRED